MGPRVFDNRDMTKRTQIERSKFLSFVLRHRPDEVGIALDAEGWVEVATLLAACGQHGAPLTRAELEEIVRTSDKQRFALSADGLRIRANQGHSVEVQLEHPVGSPPALLYHGTVARFLPSIREKGLLRGQRHHVHLAATVEAASAVGARRGEPVILAVQAQAMAQAGHAFYLSPNGVWLTDTVPPTYLVFPS